ncbi:MAG: glycogen/starch synthase [Verrucomicrobiales bacterium]
MSSTSPLSSFAKIKTKDVGEDSKGRPVDEQAEGTMPRILVVTPEITYLPEGMGNLSQRMCAKAGGLADVSASLVNELQELGADVHVALPNYKRMFHSEIQQLHEKHIDRVRRNTPEQRIHLAEDRIFYHRDQVYSTDENTRIALAFQREVINHIIPTVQPDLIHCNDWMTGLIPAVAKQRGIKCLFTVHNIHTEKLTLAEMEDRGIDAAEFWEKLYYESRPGNYEQTRSSNRVDLLTSGIFAADYVNTVSPTFLDEVVMGHHSFVPPAIQRELANKKYAGHASGILNAPDPAFEPETDEYIVQHYSPADHVEARRANKLELQKRLGLTQNADAPVLFWPSRLDPVQKGCQLVTDILYSVLADYADRGLQVAVVANGAFQEHFRNIAKMHSIHHRLAVHDFNEGLSHLGYAGSDFILMPSSFEPCGLPQMISPKFGSLPIVHDTGGLHDTIQPLNVENDTGNGFVFQYFDTAGLRWAIDEAMRFQALPADVKAQQISRIMVEAKSRFNHHATAGQYIEVYKAIWRNREA